MKKPFLSALILLAFSALSHAQLMDGKKAFTKADTLRGMLTPLRTCYDINYYHLDVKIDLENKGVSGSNTFEFTATQDFTKLQFDLFANLEIDKILYKGKKIPFTREFGAVFVTFPKAIRQHTKDKFTVFYHGLPQIANNPPWDGGFIFKKDKAGNPFVSVACQGLGASVWWPTKDHQSDEVDSMLVSITVPKDLQAVANGRLRNIMNKKEGQKQYNWFVKNPINNYNIAFYIGKYAHWSDKYEGEKGALDLDFWSLAEDSALAKPHWDADTKPMLKAFEHWFGPYPFYEDGYKLVQAPHLGMEHQSAIAYGNQFKKGYLGRDMSGTGAGLKWDYIIIHETGHEWFANNITTKDIADMWVHEGFTTYSEVLFTDYTQGKEAGDKYLIGLRRGIGNKKTIIGTYDVNEEGSGDMYPKGANLIHIIRQLINDDEKFRNLLRGLNKTFYHQTTTTQAVEAYIIAQTGLKLEKIFDQYLRNIKIPVLEYKIVNNELNYRWVSDVADFDMPIKVSIKEGEYSFIYPSNDWKKTDLSPNITAENFKIDPNFYVQTKRVD
ncbi:MAG: M1 family metallopeptidase [Sphingobacteriaceae bacterium]|nr:M1 family metallopeptidase [Sphingobacteriaceae bacterium]